MPCISARYCALLRIWSFRHHTSLDDVLVVVDVADEGIERLDALPQARFERGPFVGRQDARNDVEGNGAFGAGIVAVDREGDAHPPENQVGFGALAGQRLGALACQPIGKCLVMFTHCTVRFGHLVKTTNWTRIGHGPYRLGFYASKALRRPLAVRGREPSFYALSLATTGPKTLTVEVKPDARCAR